MCEKSSKQKSSSIGSDRTCAAMQRPAYQPIWRACVHKRICLQHKHTVWDLDLQRKYNTVVQLKADDLNWLISGQTPRWIIVVLITRLYPALFTGKISYNIVYFHRCVFPNPFSMLSCCKFKYCLCVNNRLINSYQGYQVHLLTLVKDLQCACLMTDDRISFVAFKGDLLCFCAFSLSFSVLYSFLCM